MAVISISVTASSDQIVAGIPKSISIATNIPALIFYTLDGSVPTLFSTMYTSPILLPTNSLSIILNILASNGIDSSPIITECYITNIAENTNARLPHTGTTAAPGSAPQNLYPYGTNGNQPFANYTNPADAGITVDNPALPEIPNGFDANQNPAGFTNQPYDLTNYSIQYTTTNSEGETGPGIGTLPAKVKIKPAEFIPETTQQTSLNMFDPRALVIYQDVASENPNDPPLINRMNYSLENIDIARDGAYLFSSGLDAPPVNGTFLRAHHNPRLGTITYYYLDTWSNRWIISTMPYQNSSFGALNLSQIASAGCAPGARYVYEWQEFTRRVLF